MSVQIATFYKFIDILWPSNIEKLFSDYNYFLCSFKYFHFHERLADWMQLKGKFYEFSVSPFIFNNLGFLFLIFGIIIILTLWVLLINRIFTNSNEQKRTTFNLIKKIMKWRLIILLYLLNYNYISLFSWTNIMFANTSLLGIFNLLIAIVIKLIQILFFVLVCYVLYIVKDLYEAKEYAKVKKFSESLFISESNILFVKGYACLFTEFKQFQINYFLPIWNLLKNELIIFILVTLYNHPDIALILILILLSINIIVFLYIQPFKNFIIVICYTYNEFTSLLILAHCFYFNYANKSDI